MFRLNVPASFNDCLSVKEQIMWLFFHKEFTLKAGANVTITREGDETIISAKGDGFAPIVRVSTIPGGHRITVIDSEHPDGQSFDVMDGVDGQDGTNGQDGTDGQDGADGEDGTSIIVKAVNTVPGGVNLVLEDRNGDHTIFLTNGPEGPQGATGPQGPQGIQGETGAQGPAGFSPSLSSEPISGGHRVSMTDAQGTTTFDVLDGENAAAATIMVGTTTTSAPGGNASVENVGTSTDAILNFTLPRGAQGPQGIQGIQGEQGVQGPQGEDGEQGPVGPGVAAGGTAGQVLSKVDGTDYNTEWIDPPTGIPSGGSNGDVLTRYGASGTTWKKPIGSYEEYGTWGGNSLTPTFSSGGDVVATGTNIRVFRKYVYTGSIANQDGLVHDGKSCLTLSSALTFSHSSPKELSITVETARNACRGFFESHTSGVDLNSTDNSVYGGTRKCRFVGMYNDNTANNIMKPVIVEFETYFNFNYNSAYGAIILRPFNPASNSEQVTIPSGAQIYF